MSLDAALQYTLQIADALDKAHRAGNVHRELEPDNVMLTKPGAKLLEVGLVRAGESVHTCDEGGSAQNPLRSWLGATP